MTNEPQNKGTDRELVPVETAPAMALDVMLAHTAALVAAEPDNLFPDGGSGELYASRLLGVPFVVTGTPVYRTQEARMVAVRDVDGNDTGRTKQIPAHEVCQMPIRHAYITDRTLGPVRIATLSSIYACNQVRNMTEHELFGKVWTVWENPRPDFTLPNGHGPLMLRRWTPDLLTGDAQDKEVQGSVLAADPIGPKNVTGYPAIDGALAAAQTDKPTAKVRAAIDDLKAAMDVRAGKR